MNRLENMKVFFLISVFFITIFGLCVFFTNDREQFLENSYVDLSIQDLAFIKNYHDQYEELSWMEVPGRDLVMARGNRIQNNYSYNVYMMIRFLESLVSGKYLDYLGLNISIAESKRLKYRDFLQLHDRVKRIQEESCFTTLTVKELLIYAIILREVQYTEEYQNRAWVYGLSKLSDIVRMNLEILPSLERFSKKQRDYLCRILEGMSIEKEFNQYKQDAMYETMNLCRVLEEKTKDLESSLILLLCKIAGTKDLNNDSSTILTSGYYSYVLEFEKELFIPLR